MAKKDDDDEANNSSNASRRSLNRGAWTADEDRKLAQYIGTHGPRRWKSIAIKAGLKRCGKSCRLRWLNYLRPDIKRGNISNAEEDLILRLHRLLGNRWSLIARRLPGRTDNEIKNYWNAHLRKKAKLMAKLPATPTAALHSTWDDDEKEMESSSGDGLELKEIEEEASGPDGLELKEIEEEASGSDEDRCSSSDGDGLFDFTTQGTYGLEWVKTFLELEEDS